MNAQEDPATIAPVLDSKFAAQCGRLNVDDPWFGRVVLETAAGAREYLVGPRRNVDERIVDWRHPIAAAYFDHRPGDDFDLVAPDFARLAGTVVSRAAVEAAGRRIRKLNLATPSGETVLVAHAAGFTVPSDAPATRIVPAGLPNITALLSPQQYRLITSSRDKPLIIQGKAGSGKTSVALYRVAWLTWSDPAVDTAPVDPSRVLIVMFNKALSTFVETQLEPLNLGSAQLDTFHGWALGAVGRAYGGKIEPLADDRALPGRKSAVTLKKQLGVLRATEAFVARQASAVEAWLDNKLAPYDRHGHWIHRFRGLAQPVARRIAILRSAARTERATATTDRAQRELTEIHAILNKAMERITLYKEDLLKLLTDTELLGAHLDADAAQIEDLVAYQKALQLTDGNDRRPGSKVAFADLAILLRLIQLKHGGYPNKARDEEITVFDHLIVDEAQDFGAVELQVLLGSVRSRTGVTIVGDTNQKILPDSRFIGWDALVRQLGIAGAQVARLDIAHRSTAQIMALADALVGDTSSAGRSGPRPEMTVVATPTDVLSRVAEIVRMAVTEDPAAHVCVVTGKPTAAAELRPKLANATQLDVRLGHNKEFKFLPGVTVTNVHQVKGLEFDVVVVVEPGDEMFPDDDQGRKHLYTVVTRAKNTLHFVASARPGRLVQGAIDAGHIALSDLTEVQAVTFGEQDDEPF
jgi:DNA helicase-2/ATP-dependent DNA helicase PcrA